MNTCSTPFCHKKTTSKMCSDCRDDEQKAEKFKPVIKEFVDSIEPPPGFVKTTGAGHHSGIGGAEDWDKNAPWWRKSTWVLVENKEAGIAIAMNISHLPEQRWKAGKKAPLKYVVGEISVNGHTCYKAADGGWRTFDRRGVEDSFYLGGWSDEPIDVSKTLKEQLERIEKAKETSKKMVKIPGFGYSIHQDNLDAVKKKIQSGGSHTFTPAGFGTGHVLSTRRSRWGKLMPAETAKFFGVPALYDEQFDHD